MIALFNFFITQLHSFLNGYSHITLSSLPSLPPGGHSFPGGRAVKLFKGHGIAQIFLAIGNPATIKADEFRILG